MTTNYEYYQNENKNASSAEISTEAEERIERFKRKLGEYALESDL